MALLGAPAWVRSAAAEESVLRIESRPGVTEILVLTPGEGVKIGEPGSARNAVIIFEGGSGQVSIGKATYGPDAGKWKLGGSLPVMARQALADKVGAAAVLTQPSDRSVMDQPWRDSKEHVADVAAAVTVVQQRFPGAKVWLLGLSNGSWSAAHAGAELQERLAGVILMSVAEGAFSTYGFAGIKIPVLVIQHRRDTCLPYAGVEDHARWHTFVTVDNANLPRVRSTRQDCGANSAHNFYGSETAVMAAVAQWINTGTAPAFIEEETAKRGNE